MPVHVHDTKWMPSRQNVHVAMNLELDGAWVESAASPGGKRWDASKVKYFLVFFCHFPYPRLPLYKSVA